MLRTLAILLLFATPTSAEPAATCPPAVTKSITKAFPKAAIAGCKTEREHGQDVVEVKLSEAGRASTTVDVSPDGTILQVESVIAVDALPAAVKKAFAARYPKAKPIGAEQQVAAKGSTRFEIAFTASGGRKEATFAEDGTFVEEE
jgi:hypothetical protein